jgi:hypothetical protein
MTSKRCSEFRAKPFSELSEDDDVIVHYVASLQRFYEDQEFVPPAADKGWGCSMPTPRLIQRS